MANRTITKKIACMKSHKSLNRSMNLHTKRDLEENSAAKTSLYTRPQETKDTEESKQTVCIANNV